MGSSRSPGQKIHSSQRESGPSKPCWRQARPGMPRSAGTSFLGLTGGEGECHRVLNLTWTPPPPLCRVMRANPLPHHQLPSEVRLTVTKELSVSHSRPAKWRPTSSRHGKWRWSGGLQPQHRVAQDPGSWSHQWGTQLPWKEPLSEAPAFLHPSSDRRGLVRKEGSLASSSLPSLKEQD